MGRRKRRRRKRAQFKIPLAIMGGLAALLTNKGASNESIVDAIMSGKPENIGYELREKLAGVDANGNFQLDWILQSYGPLVAGALISKFVGGSPLNLNQKLKDIPFIKI